MRRHLEFQLTRPSGHEPPFRLTRYVGLVLARYPHTHTLYTKTPTTSFLSAVNGRLTHRKVLPSGEACECRNDFMKHCRAVLIPDRVDRCYIICVAKVVGKPEAVLKRAQQAVMI